MSRKYILARYDVFIDYDSSLISGEQVDKACDTLDELDFSSMFRNIVEQKINDDPVLKHLQLTVRVVE